MYSLLSAKGLDKRGLGDWVDVDAGPKPLFELFLRYENLLIELSNANTFEYGWTSINDLPLPLRTSNVTLNQWLNTAPDYSIKLYSDTADQTTNGGDPDHVRALFLNDYGFQQKLINRNFHPDANLAPDQMIDLMLSHKDIDHYGDIVKNSIFKVNGLFHLAEALPEGIIVYEGGRTMVRCNDNRAGLLDFKPLGGCEAVPFTDDMLLNAEGRDISKAAYFRFPMSLQGKSVILVMSGMLYFIDPVLDFIGGDKIKVNFRFIDLLTQFYATRLPLYRDSTFPLELDTATGELVDSRELYTEKYIRWVMKMSQSFFVVVNTPRMSVRTTLLDNCQDPGVYRTAGHAYPDLPIRIGHGFFPEFNVHERESFYVVSAPNYLTKRAMRHKSAQSDYTFTLDQQYGYHPVDYADASQIKITAGL
ncbi:hypothetical protein RBD99_002846 [Salmonella enterica]|nr:hypothetical protein [Salmonella enterica]